MNLSASCPFSDAYCVCPLCASSRVRIPTYGLSPMAVLTGPNHAMHFWADDASDAATYTTATEATTLTSDLVRQVFSEMVKASARKAERDFLGTTSRVPDTLKEMVEE